MTDASGPQNIVVGIDGSASSIDALRWAVRQAQVTSSVVEAVMAWQFPGGVLPAGAEDFERLAGCLQSEGDHLDGKRCLCTKSVHHLAAVDDDREAMARGRDNLLAQQGSAQSLDQIKRADETKE